MIKNGGETGGGMNDDNLRAEYQFKLEAAAASSKQFFPYWGPFITTWHPHRPKPEARYYWVDARSTDCKVTILLGQGVLEIL